MWNSLFIMIEYSPLPTCEPFCLHTVQHPCLALPLELIGRLASEKLIKAQEIRK